MAHEEKLDYSNDVVNSKYTKLDVELVVSIELNLNSSRKLIWSISVILFCDIHWMDNGYA